MKRALLIGGIGLLGLSAVLLTSGLIQFVLPATFESVAKIVVQPETTGAGSTSAQGDDGTRVFDPHWTRTEVEKLQSRMVLAPVITNLDLSRKWGEKFKESELQMDATYGLLRLQLQVRPVRGTNVFEIRVTSDDPKEASAIANAIAESYRKQRILREKENLNFGSNAPAADARVAASSLIATSAVQIIDQAEPNFRPVKPHPLMKTLVPMAGLLAGVLGVVLLMLAVMKGSKTSEEQASTNAATSPRS